MTELSTIPISRLNNAELDTKIKTEIDKNGIDLSTITTNCITEIPQDIKLELNDGTLILKAGSKVYVPNGSGVFNTVTTTADISVSSIGSVSGSSFVYLINDNAFAVSLESQTTSGTTIPTSGCLYNTETNKIEHYQNGSLVRNTSFPIARITRTSGAITSIDQVFNGFGYIGSTVFALPGVKGLIPNGRNEDSTLKNIERTLSTVITRNMAGTGVCFLGASLISVFDYVPLSQYNASDTTTPSGVRRWYNPDTNYLYSIESGVIKNINVLYVGNISLDNGRITSLQPRTTFYAVDYFDAVKYSDKAEVVGWGMPDYSAAVNVSFPYTAKYDCWAYIKTTGSTGADNTIAVSGKQVYARLIAVTSTTTSMVPMSKGETLSITGSGSSSCIIYPCKGVK